MCMELCYAMYTLSTLYQSPCVLYLLQSFAPVRKYSLSKRCPLADLWVLLDRMQNAVRIG
jgi:hypothetical protein